MLYVMTKPSLNRIIKKSIIQITVRKFCNTFYLANSIIINIA